MACDAYSDVTLGGYLSSIPIIEKKTIIPAYPAAPTIRSQSVHSIIYLYVSHCAAVREALPFAEASSAKPAEQRNLWILQTL